MAWLVCPLGAAACVYVMLGLPSTAWYRFGIWMVVGVVFYFLYGFRNSKLSRASSA
jgi:APA family basic amino acid/polyamine antiporter